METNTFLAAWGVVGPLAVAVVSSVWNRKKQLHDRKDEHEQAALVRAEHAASVRELRMREEAVRKLTYRRTAFIEFIRGSYDLTWAARPHNGPGPAEPALMTSYRERFSAGFSTLLILDQAAMHEVSINLWNATFDCLELTLSPVVLEDSIERHDRLKQARVIFC